MPTVLNFDATQVEPNAPFDVVPAGMYNVKIVESEMKPTKDGQGSMLALTLEILDGEHAGRKLFDRLNLQNKNTQAMEIAYRTLSAICHAVGVYQVGDSSELHGRPMQAKVTLRPAGPGADGKQYDASNEVKGYKAIEGANPTAGAPPAAAAAPTPPAPAPAPAAPAAAATPPWAKPAAAPATPPAPAAAAPAAKPPWMK